MNTEHQRTSTNLKATTNQQEHQDNQGAILNPTVHLTRMENDNMEKFIK